MPMRISIFPLPGVILFPGLQLPLHIFEPRYRAMIKDALARDRRIGLIQPQRAEDGAPLYLSETPEGGYRLTPYDPEFEQKMAKAEDLMRRYRDTLHVLAQ